MTRGRINAGDAAPSQRWIEIRERKRKICDMIHNSNWLLGAFVQVSGVVIKFLSLNMDPYLLQALQDTIALLFARIIVPLASLFSEPKFRVAILERVWTYAIKAVLRIERLFQVQPLAKNDRSASLNDGNASGYHPKNIMKHTISSLDKISPRQPTSDNMKKVFNTPSPVKSSSEFFTSSILNCLNKIRTKDLPNTLPHDKS